MGKISPGSNFISCLSFTTVVAWMTNILLHRLMFWTFGPSVDNVWGRGYANIYKVVLSSISQRVGFDGSWPCPTLPTLSCLYVDKWLANVLLLLLCHALPPIIGSSLWSHKLYSKLLFTMATKALAMSSSSKKDAEKQLLPKAERGTGRMPALLLVEFNLVKQWVPWVTHSSTTDLKVTALLGLLPGSTYKAVIPPRHLPTTWDDSQSLHHWNILWIAYRQALPLKSPHHHHQVYILLI